MTWCSIRYRVIGRGVALCGAGKREGGLLPSWSTSRISARLLESTRERDAPPTGATNGALSTVFSRSHARHRGVPTTPPTGSQLLAMSCLAPTRTPRATLPRSTSTGAQTIRLPRVRPRVSLGRTLDRKHGPILCAVIRRAWCPNISLIRHSQSERHIRLFPAPPTIDAQILSRISATMAVALPSRHPSECGHRDQNGSFPRRGFLAITPIHVRNFGSSFFQNRRP